MKILAIPFLAYALLYSQVSSQASGQAQAPVTITPGTPTVATPPPPVAPDTVVAEVNGKKYTAADLDKLISMLPAQYQPMARSQPQMLTQVFLMQRLAQDAEKAGLDQKEPLKDQLEMSRIQVLSTAELSEVNNSMKITEADQRKYFDDNPDKFKQVKVRVIYVSFNPTPGKAAPGGKKLPTEPEAQAKIEDLEKQIKGKG